MNIKPKKFYMSFINNKNRKYILILTCFFSIIQLYAQDPNDLIVGNISYISSQNIYVQFVNTSDIQEGDTLFLSSNNKLLPALIVKSLSSISCVCNQITKNNLAISNQVFAKKRAVSKPLEVEIQKSKEAISVNDQVVKNSIKQGKKKDSDSSFDGRVSVSSYINNTSDSTINYTTRFNLSLNAAHIANSKLSAECYVSLTNKNGFIPQLGPDTLTTINYKLAPTNDLKIFNLALKYDFTKTASVTLGRKINSNMANIGAVDGLQIENNGKNISFGAFAGSRPDTYTYSFNPYLFQFGGYISHHISKEHGYMQTSLAAINQMNNFLTDRRFLYFQHSNSLLKNLDLFCSFEVDLYGANIQKDSATVKNTFGNDSTVFWNNKTPANIIDLTSAYVSLNYRPWKNVSLSMSYDARKNIYYYETYKNYIDSILDKETRQGLRFHAYYRPFKFLSIGGNAGYRFATATTASSSNEYAYITIPQVPLINASLTIDATMLNTGYLTGLIYGGSLSRDFANGKLYTELSFRHVDYTLKTTTKELENIGDLSFSWRLTKKLLLSADFEGSMDTYNKLQWRSFINLSQRF